MSRFLGELRFWFVLFICTYFLLYMFPFPLEWLPFQWGSTISEGVDNFWFRTTNFINRSVFGSLYVIPATDNGSGDTFFEYHKAAFQILLGVIVSGIWFLTDRQRLFYNRLKTFAPVYVRYFLAFMMFQYGFHKVFPIQFPEPGLIDLHKPLGEMSPMGLLWKFMGYSVPYTIFSGLLEVLGGCLLLFRQTSKLGALIVLIVMTNVFALNMTYDVPVKLLSFHLMLLSIILLAAHAKSLIHFFLLNKPISKTVIKPYFEKHSFRVISYFVKGLFIVFVSSILISNAYDNQFKFGRKMTLPPLYGIYETESFIINNDTLHPVLTDKIMWKRLIIDKFNSGIFNMQDEILYATIKVDTVKKVFEIKPFKGHPNYNLNYTMSERKLFLKGMRGRDSVQITLNIKDKNSFYLMNRGFHWINEYPNNR